MSTFRAGGWVVRPSFVPHGVTTGVTLLGDEHGLTQLSGSPEVAWQTPWSELSSVQLLRFSRGMALFATVDGVRYCWRNASRSDFDDVAAVVLAHGGQLIRRKRRAGVFAVVAVVVLASLAGTLGALFSRANVNQERLDVKAVNLTLKDLPPGWYTTSASYLEYVFSPANQVIPSTTTTTVPKPNSAWAEISARFQHCIGVPATKDRVYGLAGQEPDFQVSSPVFGSTTNGGIEVADTSQYYATTTMVRKDTAEMSMRNFGACLVASNAALILSQYKTPVPEVPIGTNWTPVTFARGWARGGVTTLSESGVAGTLHLVIVVATAGHYEVTLGALVEQWPKSEKLVANLVNVLKSRVTLSEARSA